MLLVIFHMKRKKGLHAHEGVAHILKLIPSVIPLPVVHVRGGLGVVG